MPAILVPMKSPAIAGAPARFAFDDTAGQRLLDDRMLNVVLVLVFATSVLGPVLTERFASRLTTGTRRA